MYHWYDGDDPPLTGVAVKVTWVPAQTVLEGVAIETLTGNMELTVKMAVLDVADGLDQHPPAVAQQTQYTWSLLAGTYDRFMECDTISPFTYQSQLETG